MILNIAGNQPIHEVITNVDIAFSIGIGLGFLVGIVTTMLVFCLYMDYINKRRGII